MGIFLWPPCPPWGWWWTRLIWLLSLLSDSSASSRSWCRLNFLLFLGLHVFIFIRLHFASLGLVGFVAELVQTQLPPLPRPPCLHLHSLAFLRHPLGLLVDSADLVAFASLGLVGFVAELVQTQLP